MAVGMPGVVVSPPSTVDEGVGLGPAVGLGPGVPVWVGVAVIVGVPAGVPGVPTVAVVVGVSVATAPTVGRTTGCGAGRRRDG